MGPQGHGDPSGPGPSINLYRDEGVVNMGKIPTLDEFFARAEETLSAIAQEQAVFNVGDLVETTVNLILKDEMSNLTEKLDRQAVDLWDRKGPEEFTPGITCMFLGDSQDDPEVAMVAKDLIGKTLLVRKEYLRIVALAGSWEDED